MCECYCSQQLNSSEVHRWTSETSELVKMADCRSRSLFWSIQPSVQRPDVRLPQVSLESSRGPRQWLHCAVCAPVRPGTAADLGAAAGWFHKIKRILLACRRTTWIMQGKRKPATDLAATSIVICEIYRSLEAEEQHL